MKKGGRYLTCAASLLLAAVGLLALCGCRGGAEALEPDVPLFTFVHLSDTHCLTTDAKPVKPPAIAFLKIAGYKPHWKDLPNAFPNLKHTVRFLNETVKPDFAVITGDLTENGNLADMTRVKATLEALDAASHPVMGDHDLGMSQSAFQKDKAASTYARVFGKRCYSFDLSGWHFIVLGIFPDDDEIEWLRQDLAQAGDRPVILATHRLVFVDSVTQAMARIRYGVPLLMPKAQQVQALLIGHGNVVAVLSGHCHCTLRWRRDDIEYLTAATLAGVPIQFRTFAVYADRIETGLYQAGVAEDAAAGRWEFHARDTLKLR